MTDHIMRFSDDELRRIRFALESHLLRSGQSIESDPGWTIPYRDLLARIVGQMSGTDRRVSDLPSWSGNAVADEQISEPYRRRLSDLFKKATADRPTPKPPLWTDPTLDTQYAPGTLVRITIGELAGKTGTIVRYVGNQTYTIAIDGRYSNVAYGVGNFAVVGFEEESRITPKEWKTRDCPGPIDIAGPALPKPFDFIRRKTDKPERIPDGTRIRVTNPGREDFGEIGTIVIHDATRDRYLVRFGHGKQTLRYMVPAGFEVIPEKQDARIPDGTRVRIVNPFYSFCGETGTIAMHDSAMNRYMVRFDQVRTSTYLPPSDFEVIS